MQKGVRVITPDPLQLISQALDASAAETSDFDLNPEVVLPEGRVLRPAAVLVPILTDGGVARVILTKRASGMKHHPGQIALPGGKVDAEDADEIAAALREAEEEIGLSRDNVEVLGTMPSHETVTGFRVTPVVAQVKQLFDPVAEIGEVAETFSVPLDHLLNVDRYSIQSRYWRKQRRYYYTVPYGPYYIWGATARILRAMADRAAR